jgi:hypothetical protein
MKIGVKNMGGGYSSKKGALPALSVLGIDPGIYGAFVLTDGEAFVRTWEMPVISNGKEKRISFEGVSKILKEASDQVRPKSLPVFLERAVPFAMGAKSAFNYGRGFEVIELAIKIQELSLTLIEPTKWTKEMHQGIKDDLKPKAKSRIAVERLFPKILKQVSGKSSQKYFEGIVDAILISGYGLRKFKFESTVNPSKVETPERYILCGQCRNLTYSPKTGKCTRWGCPDEVDKDFY